MGETEVESALFEMFVARSRAVIPFARKALLE
jgi:hypothetical protein